MQLDLVTIGDLNMDTLMSVPRFPRVDDEVQVHSMQRFAGGDAANVAVAASKLGLHTALIASVGKDADGRTLLEALQHPQVETQGIRLDGTEGTGSVISIVRSDGERNMLTYRGANQNLSIAHRQARLFRQTRAIHISDPLPGIIRPLARAIEAAEALVSLDPGSITASRGLEPLLPILSQATIFLANEAEYLMITGGKTLLKAVGQIRAEGPKIAVVKLGRKGCAVFTDAENITVPGFRVKAVDSTGAGDAFDAAFIAGILENMPLRQAARFANAVGALATTKVGAQTGVPNRAQVRKFISNN